MNWPTVLGVGVLSLLVLDWDVNEYCLVGVRASEITFLLGERLNMEDSGFLE